MEDDEVREILGESGHGRTKKIGVFRSTCDRCFESSRVVISTDTSNGEYGPLDLCIECINDLQRKFLRAEEQEANLEIDNKA